MREKKEERSVHVRKDNRGITFVELIIAIAVSTIILGAATLFLELHRKIIMECLRSLICSRNHRF